MSALRCVLLIEDNDEHARIISRHLHSAERSMVKVIREIKLTDGLKRLDHCHFNVVLLDLRLPDSDIDNTLPATLKHSGEVPIVVLSSLEDRELAIRSVQEGAQDYLCKADLSPELLIRAIYSAIERKGMEERLREQTNQTQALFELGQIAISSVDTDTVMQRAVELVAKSLNVEMVRVLKLQSDRKSFLFESGVGWQPGLIGHSMIPADLTTHAGYTLHASRPVKRGDLTSHESIVVDDLRTETRFKGHHSLLEHGATSGISVIVYGKDEMHPHGVLSAYSRPQRHFSQEEANFLQTVANTLAAAILQRDLQKELKKRIEELDTANRRKDEFLATLSHELRTPLNVISGNLQLLHSLDRQSQEFTEAMAAIERGVRDETQLVNDTLEMSRIITGKLKLTMSSFSIASVIDGAIDSIKFAAAAKNIQIHCQAPSPEVKMVGDESRLRQVAWNLLSNAVKFTPSSGQVWVQAQAIGTLLKLSISDTGIGLDPEKLPHVFERFWQEESTIDRRFMGLGLGLSIVQNIVEHHGGTVSVTSSGQGKGATFTVLLPLMPVNILTSEPPTAQTSPRVAPPVFQAKNGRLDGVKLLLIDDSVDSLKLLEKLLARQGASVTSFSNPKEGLEAATARDFDVIISDIGMPEISGFDLMSRLRAWEDQHHRSHQPSIALTAYATHEDAEHALASGFQLHVPKPVNFATLSEAIRTLIKGHDLA